MLAYVDDGFYDGLLFHRVLCTEIEEEETSSDGTTAEDDAAETDDNDIAAVLGCDPFVIQTGGYRRTDGELEQAEATRDPVTSEADNGLSNATPYSVAMALAGGDVDSGTTEFFINIDADNGYLDDQYFTVFGSVVDDGGREIVGDIVDR